MTSCVKSLRLIATTTSLGVSLALLGACSSGNVKETLGINRVAPDEFRVVSRPPLTVPPQFSLLPPSIEADAPGQVPASDTARDVVMGGQVPADNLGGGPAADTAVAPVASKNIGKAKAASGASAAEENFLKQAGTPAADPSIRKQLVEERVTKQITEEEEGWWDRMSILPKANDPTVDASKEAERIKENEDTGKPANEGETAVVKPTDRGVLGRILGDD
jgi:hypothetical protein